MKVILTSDVKKLGQAGDVVEVSDGYARNFLLARGLARFADEHSINQAKASTKAKERAEQAQKEAATRLARSLSGKVLEFSLPGAARGKLYAGLKDSEILDKIRKDFKDLPESARLAGYHPLKESGEHLVKLSLPDGKIIEVKVKINQPNE